MAVDTKATLTKIDGHLLDVTMGIEGIAAALLALASDLDGRKLVSRLQATRLLELLAGACEGIQQQIGEAAELVDDLAAECGPNEDEGGSADDTP